MDLKDWIDRANQLYSGFGARLKGNPGEFHFPSGAIIYTGHLSDESAYTKYQGQQYQKIIIEELTHIASEELYEKLISSCRSKYPKLKPQVFCTTNPGGVGHMWVKRRWRIPDDPYHLKETDHKPGTTFIYDVEIKPGESIKMSRIFVPSTVDDNPTLIDNDPRYLAQLNSIQDEATRMQWRYGSWADYEIRGAYYAFQMKQARIDGRIRNVPYDPGVPVDTWWDLGVGDATAIVFTQSIGENVYIIDYYEASGEGLRHYLDHLKSLGYRFRTYGGPHDLGVREWGSGKTRYEQAMELGVDFELVTRMSIDDGIQAVREILGRCYFDEKNCESLINILKNYRKEYDEERLVYKNSPLHDWTSHGADAFRYMAVGIQKYIKPAGKETSKTLIQKANQELEGMRIRMALQSSVELPQEEEYSW